MLAALTLLALASGVPGSLAEAWERGGFYVFTREFMEDIPRRLTGPGRFRFLLQPLMATALGIRSGLGDVRAGRPPYLWAIVTAHEERRAMMREGCLSIVNVLMMGILLDCIAQWLILGACYPGAALVVGPVLIVAPYSISRALTARVASRSAPPSC